MEIQFVLGDWSKDGHGITKLFTFDINADRDRVMQAYAAGCEIVGFDLTDYCADFEENTIPAEIYDKFIAAGGVFEKGKEPEVNDIDADIPTEYFMYIDSYMYMWLGIAKIGLPELTWKEVRCTSIDIGGYGLFTP